MSTVRAQKNGEVREFDSEFWENMPADKYGWAPSAEEPEILHQQPQGPGPEYKPEEKDLKPSPEPVKNPEPAKAEEVKENKAPSLADKLKNAADNK